MIKFFTLCGILFVSFTINAQNSNAIFFTENGERFQIVLNGILQNAKAETNVKLTQLPANRYKCRIIFEDFKFGYTDFNLFFPEQGDEVTWNIKKNTKGEYVVRFVSAVSIAEAPKRIPADPVYIFSEAPGTETTTTIIQQTQTTGSNGENVNIIMGANAAGDGGNISIQSSGMNGNTNETGYSSTTTTTTTTRTVTSGSTLIEPPPQVVYVPGYTGKVGCPVPINPEEFSQMKETISSKDFENTKLTIAKQILQNNCLTSSQVREILGIFDFENTKLEFAKYAYDKTYDVGNYYKVNDAFQFESSVDELNKYISKK